MLGGTLSAGAAAGGATWTDQAVNANTWDLCNEKGNVGQLQTKEACVGEIGETRAAPAWPALALQLGGPAVVLTG